MGGGLQNADIGWQRERGGKANADIGWQKGEGDLATNDITELNDLNWPNILIFLKLILIFFYNIVFLLTW